MALTPPILGVEPRSPEGRTALEAVVTRTREQQDLPQDWSYSLAWFLDLYGSPTEAALLAAEFANTAVPWFPFNVKSSIARS
jgi:hypothetical protein